MGTQITLASKADRKAQFTVATVAAAALSIVDGQLAIFIGSTPTDREENFSGLLRCLQALRERSNPNPATLTFNSAFLAPGGDNITVALGTALPTVAETDVAVLYGFDFNTDGASITSPVRRAMERFLENVK